MKKMIWLLFGVLWTVGCSGLQREAAEVWDNTAGPVVAQTGQAQDGVRLVVRRPAGSCTFKGGILGDFNPDEAGVPSSVFNMNGRIRKGLVSSAKQMGGNTVWLRTADWQNPDVSTDYYRPFFVNNVEYSALVYDCPAE